MDNEKHCCSNCEFYCKNDAGEMVCTDFDGLYFDWVMEPDERCPDYSRSDVQLEISA